MTCGIRRPIGWPGTRRCHSPMSSGSWVTRICLRRSCISTPRRRTPSAMCWPTINAAPSRRRRWHRGQPGPRCTIGLRPWTLCSEISGERRGTHRHPGARPGGVPVRARRLTAEAAALWQKFPPRLLAASWPATEHGRGTVVSQAMARPYAAEENDQSRYFRRLGVIRILDWRDTAERWLKDTGRIAPGNRTVWRSLGGALGLLIGCDVIRPDLGWLLTSATPAHLAADMARVRDPDGFAALQKVAGPASVSVTSTRRAMLQIAVMMSVKGGPVGDITVGDCLELLEARARSRGDGDNGGTYFYQLLHAAGFFPAGTPFRVGMLDPRVHGQQTAGQLIDRYDLACRPIRDLLVGYLNERRPGIDYVTMSDLAYQLGLLFWKDLETHHPGVDSLDLEPDVAVAWKQRMQYRTVKTTGPDGERTQTQVPRLSVVDDLTRVRSFYLDIAECATN